MKPGVMGLEGPTGARSGAFCIVKELGIWASTEETQMNTIRVVFWMTLWVSVVGLVDYRQ